MTTAQPCSVGIVGAGNMGGSLLQGLLDAGVHPQRLTAVDQVADILAPLAARGVVTGSDLSLACEDRDVVIIGVKPQSAAGVLGALAPHLKADQLIVSIMAGVTTDHIAQILGADQPVVRVMPQTLVRLQAGATAVASGRHTTPQQVSMVVDLFSRVGSSVEVSEGLLDAVTGLSGSGPAYVYTIIEALADGGVKAGLPRDTALQLAAQTVAGAGRMVLETGEHPATLRDQVTSPGGTTIAGLSELEAGRVRHALIRAVEAATQRAQELGRVDDSRAKGAS
ncbi:MAG: pyrroline-5-carboxylate reductase [Candidatus Latescibacterota bacterium]|nr:pyrroline-5-carboxylate reductase [Candidatus Latescibacterota bacterium]